MTSTRSTCFASRTASWRVRPVSRTTSRACANSVSGHGAATADVRARPGHASLPSTAGDVGRRLNRPAFSGPIAASPWRRSPGRWRRPLGADPAGSRMTGRLLPLFVRLALRLRPVRLPVRLQDQPDSAVDVEVLAADLAGGVALTRHVVEVERMAVVGRLDAPVLAGRRAKQVRLDARARQGPPLREDGVPKRCTRPVAPALRP